MRSKWRRRIFRYGLPLVAAWLLASHLLVRPALENWLRDHFEGEPSVAFALLWPNASATAWGVAVRAENHTLEADRVSIDLRLFSVFGGRVVRSARITGLAAVFAEGSRLKLFRRAASAVEGEAAGDGADLDPVRLPPLVFMEPSVRIGAAMAFRTGRLNVTQSGDRVLDLSAEPGVAAAIPFEKITARLMPRGDRLLFGSLKMRSFNGLLRGFVDIDTTRTGSLNGELEWFAVEADRVWATYGLPYAEKRRGDLSGKVIFRADAFSTGALQGKGTIRLDQAEFFSPLSFKVFLVLKIPSGQEAPLSRAEMTVSFENGIAYLEEAHAYARDFQLDGQGLLTFDGDADLEIRHAGTTVAVRGPVEDPTVKVLPLDHVTLPFDRLFRERIRTR